MAARDRNTRTPQIVDAHHHLWDPSRIAIPWIENKSHQTNFLGDYSSLPAVYLPDDYRADADGINIVATVHIEAEVDRSLTLEESAWITSVNEAAGMPNAMVGHAWLNRPDLSDMLAAHSAYGLFRGIRSKPITAERPDSTKPDGKGSMADPDWRSGLKVLEASGFSYDFRVPYWHLSEGVEILSAVPDLPVVLNHVGLPWDRSDAGLAIWRTGMTALAQLPNVHVKLSEFGLPDGPWEYQQNYRIVRETLDLFGPNRCMWASNFPVSGLRIGYRDLFDNLRAMVQDLSEDEQDMIFRRTAANFYRLDLP